MERNQDLTIAYITVKVNGGTNVLRNTKLATREKRARGRNHKLSKGY